ncbi:class I poly(R)-hydroxyalkanoic acid synthase [Alkalilacustris brevis]|uniref:class I poly(R)-hydroxyalkanoic acid synthase n=1 Tax=Alkalilacustris brevis TaxID=2026338 RepID=UPI000E0D99A9|nr:class I poly(R)-hydroxyalkanoic acid synthase [Alkalilacustris brevis]
MTTDHEESAEKLDRLNANLKRIEELSQRLMAAMGRRRGVRPSLQGPDQELFMKAGAAYMTEMMKNPSRIIEQQVSYWGNALKHYVEAQEALRDGTLTPPTDNTPHDRRFSNPLWNTHPYFNYLKQQYLMTSEAMERAVAELDHLSPRDRKRLQYFSRQIIDMFSPANFLSTNPEALARAVETDGESLVKGLENLVRDIEANDGELLVTLADRGAFRVGENLATTPGQVVYRNRMFELIQYTPTTEKVHRTPLIIFPPWINKFYIMDLKPQNSLVKWIVDQGYTLFVVSWVNPDASYADVGLDTYIEEGYLEAIAQVKAITGEDKVNAVGYCIAGTTLALTLALLHKRKDRSVRSATFFTTLTDFADQGEFSVFLEDDFVDGIEAETQEKGFLHAFFMSRTFSFLRSNDLVYGPAIRSYMLGEAPPAFDLLYWNGDSTNLPGRMAVEYLRWLCQQNRFATGEIEMFGQKLSLKDVRLPLCAIACETDHIAHWRGSFAGIAQMGSRDRSFILSESGHIAGIVNPPEKKKYGHYVSDAPLEEPESWRAGAERHDGSWWPRWEAWLARRSGAMVPAREPGGPDHPPLCPAPGQYVLSRPEE